MKRIGEDSDVYYGCCTMCPVLRRQISFEDLQTQWHGMDIPSQYISPLAGLRAHIWGPPLWKESTNSN